MKRLLKGKIISGETEEMGTLDKLEIKTNLGVKMSEIGARLYEIRKAIDNVLVECDKAKAENNMVEVDRLLNKLAGLRKQEIEISALNSYQQLKVGETREYSPAREYSETDFCGIIEGIEK